MSIANAAHCSMMGGGKKPPASVKVLTFNTVSNGSSYGYARNNPQGKINLSFGGWVNPTATTFCPLFGWQSTGSWGGLNVGSRDGDIYIRGGNRNRQLSFSQYQYGVWQHIFVVSSATSFKVYVNGQLARSVNDNKSTIGSEISTRFLMAAGTTYNDRDNITAYWTNVALFAVCAFNRTLSDGEVMAIYTDANRVDLSKAPYDDGLWFAYNLDGDSVPTSVPDLCGGTPLTIATPSHDAMATDFIIGT